jgi:hypothetical protein
VAGSFDTVRHDRLLGKVARRVQDPEILQLLKRMLKASGKRGVPGWGDLAAPGEHLPDRSGCDAGAGQGGDPERRVDARGVRAVHRRPCEAEASVLAG